MKLRGRLGSGLLAGTLLAAAALGAGWHASRRDGDDPKLGEAMRLIRDHYAEPVPRERLVDAALRGMVGALDPNSDYLNAAQSTLDC